MFYELKKHLKNIKCIDDGNDTIYIDNDIILEHDGNNWQVIHNSFTYISDDEIDCIEYVMNIIYNKKLNELDLLMKNIKNNIINDINETNKQD